MTNSFKNETVSDRDWHNDCCSFLSFKPLSPNASLPNGTHWPDFGLTPSMRRPVDVKAYFAFFFSVSLLPFSQAASVAILPSALFCERYSLGARWVFSFQ